MCAHSGRRGPPARHRPHVLPQLRVLWRGGAGAVRRTGGPGQQRQRQRRARARAVPRTLGRLGHVVYVAWASHTHHARITHARISHVLHVRTRKGVCFITSQHTLNQLRLQQYTTATVYVSSKLPSPQCPTLHKSRTLCSPSLYPNRRVICGMVEDNRARTCHVLAGYERRIELGYNARYIHVCV